MMPAPTPPSPRLPVDYVYEWFAQHPTTAIWSVVLLFGISIAAILRLWIVHRRTSLHEKIIWSFFLLFPVLGWIFYAGFFRVPDYSATPLLNEYTSNNQ